MVAPAGSIADLIGNTPLLRLKFPSEETGCNIYGKCEFMNPGQSIKDRAALSIINQAEKDGLIRPGGIIVEGTAGNTGIGLAMVAASKGYRCVIVIPETQSQEKKDAIGIYGAKLVEVPAAPFTNPNNYIRYSQRLAAALNDMDPAGAIWANQFDNLANRQAHIDHTAPEIIRQLDGNIHGFTCAMGTGGTLAGVHIALKAYDPGIQVALTDPMGSGMYHYFVHGSFNPQGNSITEGIGNNRLTANMEGISFDHHVQIGDDEALTVAFRLLREEGLNVGGSTGINVAGAMALAKKMGPGHNIATILCDLGTRYQSKLFNEDFLKSKSLPTLPKASFPDLPDMSEQVS